jgi:hypothetical protein
MWSSPKPKSRSRDVLTETASRPPTVASRPSNYERGHGVDAAQHVQAVPPSRLEAGNKHRNSPLGSAKSTRVKVNCGIPSFRPCVNGEVRFGKRIN